MAAVFLAVVSQAVANYTIITETVPHKASAETIQFNKNGLPVTSEVSENPRATSDNYGDLIYRWRENKDTLLVREVVINRELTSEESDLIWYVTVQGARITSVRVLNFGRSRAACYRIDVAGGDVQVVIRVPPLGDPRILIEVYGY